MGNMRSQEVFPDGLYLSDTLLASGHKFYLWQPPSDNAVEFHAYKDRLVTGREDGTTVYRQANRGHLNGKWAHCSLDMGAMRMDHYVEVKFLPGTIVEVHGLGPRFSALEYRLVGDSKKSELCVVPPVYHALSKAMGDAPGHLDPALLQALFEERLTVEERRHLLEVESRGLSMVI